MGGSALPAFERTSARLTDQCNTQHTRENFLQHHFRHWFLVSLGVYLLVSVEEGIVTLRPRTRIETLGTPAMGGFAAVPPEPGIICKPRRGEGTPGPDWHLVAFDDGARLCLHETRFRVVSNR
jgi:hypothetical protein